MARIDHLHQLGTQKVILFGGWEWGLIDNPKSQEFWEQMTKYCKKN
ncbi:hypothetical protein SAMN04489859_102715 [Paracoccus alcaliphilus]|uniref:Uncharacterized protein n=1 Tax=Paracoccus alcaliphilus TaxID=34002 RepID=A0A1H8L2N7_9RHOB|nr:hypothetical protein SAMN04489859_102715 [Paracoccus alcaliphilus]